MIHTVTLNPSLDRTVIVDELVVGGLNRIRAERSDAAGKGANVSKAIRVLGDTSIAWVLLAGQMGRTIESGLEGQGLVLRTFRCEGENRVNTKILDRSTDTMTEVNGAGPAASSEVLAEMLTALVDEVATGDLVVLAGSLCPDAPASTYRDWAERLAAKGARIYLDAGEEALRFGIEAHPALIKPNAFELSRLLDRELADLDAIVDGAKELAATGVGRVVVTLGGDGAVLVDDEDVIFASAPHIEVGSPAGAGDSVVAALAYADVQGLPADEALALAMACGAANASVPGSEPADLATIEALLPAVKVREL